MESMPGYCPQCGAKKTAEGMAYNCPPCDQKYAQERRDRQAACHHPQWQCIDCLKVGPAPEQGLVPRYWI